MQDGVLLVSELFLNAGFVNSCGTCIFNYSLTAVQYLM